MVSSKEGDIALFGRSDDLLLHDARTEVEGVQLGSKRLTQDQMSLNKKRKRRKEKERKRKNDEIEKKRRNGHKKTKTASIQR